MTRRRKVTFMLKICTGVLVLLFGVTAAETSKGPAINLEKPSTSSTSETILGKSVLFDGNNGPIDLNRTNSETVHDELIKDAKSEDEEKVQISIGKESDVQGIGKIGELNRIMTADSTNGGSKLDEIFYETLGKGSSTKAVFEHSYRLPRTNDLASTTTKSTTEESKLDETKVKSITTQQSEDNDEGSNTTSNPNIEIKDVSKEQYINSALNVETIDDTSDPSIQKAPFMEQFPEGQKNVESLNSTKNFEVLDLKGTDESNGNRKSISLINDTYVNYSSYHKSSTENNLDAGSRNQSKDFENITDCTSEPVTIDQDPKEEVEVVGRVTHSVVQRITEQQQNELNQQLNHDKDSFRNFTKLTKIAETNHVIEQREQIGDKNRQTLVQTMTEKLKYEESSTFQTPSNPIPRGKTIAFSDVNEFPSLETKPPTALKLGSPSSKNTSTNNFIEQKPYPYAKSFIPELLHNSSNQIDVATKEVSTLENTISKGPSDEKLIVTEASDVLENSIQQFKPMYYDQLNNESSTVSSTETHLSALLITVSTVTPEEATPMNRTAVDKSNDLKEIVKSKDKLKSTENNVSRWSKTRETISGEENLDVSGNKITKVSLKPDTIDRNSYEISFQEITGQTTTVSLATESTVQPQLESGTFSDIDVQSNAEDSLLIRPLTLNATEFSIEYPLVKGNFSQEEQSTISVTSGADIATTKITESITVLPITITIEKTFTGDITDPPTSSIKNGTNNHFGGRDNFIPVETSMSTATSIEYEFVGLSESTTLPNQNITEGDLDRSGSQNEISTTIPTGNDLLIQSSLNETSTTTNEGITTDTPSSTDETEVTTIDNKFSDSTVTDQTVISTSILSLIKQSDDFTTISGIIEGETVQISSNNEVQKTISTRESWFTTDGGANTTIKIEQTLPNSKNVHLVSNATRSSIESTTALTIATRMITSTTLTSTSFQPRIPISSTIDAPAASDIPVVETNNLNVSPTQEDVMPMIRIVIEGNLYDLCPKKNELKTILANLLGTGLNKTVSDKQIIFHEDPCRESPSSTPTPLDMPLTSILIYVVDENGKFDSSMTEILPTLYKNSEGRIQFPITVCSFLLIRKTVPDSGNAIAVVVVSTIAFICLILLAGLLFIMRKRQTRFNYGERCRPVSLDSYSLDSVPAYSSVRRKGVLRTSKRSYGNPTFEDSSAIPSHPLNFAGLSSFCNDVNAISQEFANIPQISAKIDEMPSGAEIKNRYANVIPLPETRVPLQKVNNDPLSEYINASYVRGPKNAMRYYIACQAPMDCTVTDFWRMIWEQQSKVIIMLTDLVENGVEKCTEYVPPSEVTDCHRLYGDFQVTLKKRETKEKYAISTLHLKNLENNTFREVYHIWYLWPVNGVQSDGAGLIAVLLEARALQRGGPGPIVVHCSPGTGRTGTLIALDLGIRQYEITRTVDVPRVVYTIRRDRAGAVQTKEQYAFIYKALNLYATKLAGGVLEST